ncbi:MAG: hypothetical protein DWQ54_07845 [Microcystis flos-aquae TF09]|uniref:Uncharacterized protein n=1 Tax=Microcystis flos-aquae TF09 TaxID=2060473 RepID=A0A3E0L5Z7_9CHRO|nr:MAG: hypothetical protein DWQ54_07845 [Microcystis flos-aquae TF09]
MPMVGAHRVRPKCNIDISTKLRCTQSNPIQVPLIKGDLGGYKPIQVPLIKGDLGGSNQFKSPLSRGI